MGLNSRQGLSGNRAGEPKSFLTLEIHDSAPFFFVGQLDPFRNFPPFKENGGKIISFFTRDVIQDALAGLQPENFENKTNWQIFRLKNYVYIFKETFIIYYCEN